MVRALFTAATGMEAQQINIDVIANNLANVNTAGFKRSRADFQDLLYQTVRAAGTATAEGSLSPTGIQVGLGVRPVSVQKVFDQGDFTQTGNELDMVIEGDGFFQVTRPNGEIGYTRSGAFKRDSEGNLVNSDGYPLEPAISIPADTTKIDIAADGTISVLQAGSITPTEVGQVELARFANPAGLDSAGRNIYVPTDSSGEATTGTPDSEGFGSIGQGFLEMSNVNVVDELIGLIVSQRAYEMNSKVVQASDEMLQMANNMRR